MIFKSLWATSFEKRVHERDPLWEPNVFSPLMGHEDYFEKLPCACVVLFIDECCVQMSFKVEPESGRRRLRRVLRNSGLGGNYTWCEHSIGYSAEIPRGGVFSKHSVTLTRSE